MPRKLPTGARAALLLLLVAGGALVARWYAARQPAGPASAEAVVDRYSPSSLPAETARKMERVRFTDAADSAGLRYRWQIPGKRPLNILQTIGSGCAFLDYDGDGKLDILLVGAKPALYRGDGAGHFTDVTHQTGLDRLRGHFLGCAVGDYDNDGYDDVYLSGWRTGVLLHNEHGRGFRDVTREAGLAPQPWGTSCAWGDLDGDGYLDLYVCNYVEFGPNTIPQLCTAKGAGGRDVRLACEPGAYRALKGVLYHNLGGRRFEDVTRAWGADKTAGAGLGAAFGDFDGTGRIGLAVANDERPGDLFEWAGKRLRNVGVESGTASDAGHVHGGMGLDWGDYDNDSRMDLFVCTFEGQVKDLYRNQGGGLFQDASAAVGIHHFTRHLVAFGCKFLDADNDGWLDLLIANGHTYDNVADVLPGRRYRQPTQLLYNVSASRFLDASPSAGIEQMPPIVGRGLAVGDYDNDGRMDALVVDAEGKPQLLHNETTGAGHWLSVRLVGTKCNRDGYGALVTARAGPLTEVRACHADGSYLSSSDSRVHLGLGAAQKASLTVRWPDGHTDTWNDVACDRRIRLREGARDVAAE
jgi:enediyne biosynthesis protein E4